MQLMSNDGMTRNQTSGKTGVSNVEMSKVRSFDNVDGAKCRMRRQKLQCHPGFTGQILLRASYKFGPKPTLLGNSS